MLACSDNGRESCKQSPRPPLDVSKVQTTVTYMLPYTWSSPTNNDMRGLALTPSARFDEVAESSVLMPLNRMELFGYRVPDDLGVV